MNIGKMMARRRWGKEGTPERQAAKDHQANKLSAYWANMTPEERSSRMRAIRDKGIRRKLIESCNMAVQEGIDGECTD